MSKHKEVARIEITQYIDKDGELIVDWEASDGLSFVEMIGLVEMTKLSMHEFSMQEEDDDE